MSIFGLLSGLAKHIEPEFGARVPRKAPNMQVRFLHAKRSRRWLPRPERVSRGGSWIGMGRWLGIGAVAFALAGCSGTLGGLTRESPAEVKAEAAKARTQAKWAAILQGDLDTAYAFLSPASRSLVSRDAFKAQFRRPFRSMTVDAVACEPEICKVKITVYYDHPMMKNIPAPVEESWVLEQGQLWFVARQ